MGWQYFQGSTIFTGPGYIPEQISSEKEDGKRLHIGALDYKAAREARWVGLSESTAPSQNHCRNLEQQGWQQHQEENQMAGQAWCRARVSSGTEEAGTRDCLCNSSIEIRPRLDLRKSLSWKRSQWSGFMLDQCEDPEPPTEKDGKGEIVSVVLL